jgi:predicted nucleic-acid-binding Zn-ribbon protein
MTDTTIGGRLPAKLFEKVHDRLKRVNHTRTCKGCGYKFPTVEVTLVQKWSGKKFDCCPIHTSIRGEVVSQISVSRSKSGYYYSHGLFKVVSLGGYYRRRKCNVTTGIEERELKKCDIKWTTGEFASDGTVAEDVQKCPKCGSVKTRTERRKQNRT